MEAKVIKIGNSRGLRLSKQLIDQYHITDQVDLILEKDYIIIKPISKPREGWNEAFKAMHRHDEDKLLINDVLEDEHFEEW